MTYFDKMAKLLTISEELEAENKRLREALVMIGRRTKCLLTMEIIKKALKDVNNG